MARKIKRIIFDDLIIGLGGKDALASLEALADIQKKLQQASVDDNLGKSNGLSTISSLQKKIAAYPLRYRVIYKGFCNHWTLAELNDHLAEKGQEKLYARDLIEASLIYAFHRQLSYPEWKMLIDKLKILEKDGSYDSLLLNGYHGSYTAFPLARVRDYVKRSSLLTAGSEYTMQRTKTVEMGLQKQNTDHAFSLYMCENIHSFCEGREKARYYLCKYFLLYLNTQIDYYQLDTISRKQKQAIYKALPLSNISAMDPNRHASLRPEEIERCLEKAKISSNKLFTLVNHFYDYALLAESDAEDPNWEEYSLITKVLSGDRISRNLLLLLLLFFGSEASIQDNALRLDTYRMDQILTACRFSPLDADKRSLDLMISQALRSEDPKGAIENSLYELESLDLQ